MSNFLILLSAALMAVFIFGGTMIYSTIVNGWVLSILWGWFVVPVFGLSPLTVGQAIGISLVVNFLTYQWVDAEPRKKSDIEQAVYTGLMILYPFLVLGIGYIIHLFLG